MKIIPILALLAGFLVCVPLAASDGFMLEYKTAGQQVGGTKVEGNLKVIFRAGAKRLSGATVFYEPGNPFPDMEEKEYIFDLVGKKKLFHTEDGGDWADLDLSADYKIVTDKKVQVTFEKNANSDVIKLDVAYGAAFGGPARYLISFDFDTQPAADSAQLRKIVQPVPADLISFFVDNEKIADIVDARLGEDRFRVPSHFHIVCEQGGKKAFDITGDLRSSLRIDLNDRDFQPK